jgi:hypothetical protein
MKKFDGVRILPYTDRVFYQFSGGCEMKKKVLTVSLLAGLVFSLSAGANRQQAGGGGGERELIPY